MPCRPVMKANAIPLRSWRCGHSAWAALAVCASAGLPAHAVITTVTDTGSNYSLYLRVGSEVGVDTVTFDVTGNNVGLTPTAVVGTPAIDVWVTPLRPATSSSTARPVTLRVSSPAFLACQSGGCGSTQIPFGKISWAASANSGPTSGDIQSTSSPFTGGANQLIASFNANAGSYCPVWPPVLCSIFGGYVYETNTLQATRMTFSYANDVIYPAGTYRGTVRFTASME